MLLITISLCGCHNYDLERLEREIEVKNRETESLMTEYTTNEEKTKAVEDDIVNFLLTGKSTEALKEFSKYMGDITEFDELLYISGVYEGYAALKTEDEIKEYMSCYNKDDSEILYYINTSDGSLEFSVYFYTGINRDIEFVFFIKEGTVSGIRVTERGRDNVEFDKGY